MSVKITKKQIKQIIRESLEEIIGDLDTGRFDGGGGRDPLANIGSKKSSDVDKMKAKRSKMAGGDTLDRAINTNIELAQHLVDEMERIIAQNPKLDPEKSLRMILQKLKK